MRKKIIILSILAVFMLVTISFVTAASMQTTKTIKEKVSPLFKIRSRQANNENIRDIIKHIGQDRVFFVLFPLLSEGNFPSIRQQIQHKFTTAPEKGCTIHAPCTFLPRC